MARMLRMTEADYAKRKPSATNPLPKPRKRVLGRPGASQGQDWGETLDFQFRAIGGQSIPYLEYCFARPRKWRFDLAWPDLKIAVEIDGGVWISGRHNRGMGFINDMEKLSEAAILGWCVIRVTPQQVKSGHALALVGRALTMRGNLALGAGSAATGRKADALLA